MNKQKFVSALRNPRELSGQDLNEIKDVIKTYPYFVSARSLLAKGVKLKYPEKSGKFVASASLYVPDRGFFKKYIENDLYFVGESANTKEGVTGRPEAKKGKASTQKAKKSSKVAAAPDPGHTPVPKKQQPGALDDLISDIFSELEELKASKKKFKEMESRLLEDEEVERVLARAQESQPEVEAEETPKAESQTDESRGEDVVEEVEIPKEEPEASKTASPVENTGDQKTPPAEDGDHPEERAEEEAEDIVSKDETAKNVKEVDDETKVSIDKPSSSQKRSSKSEEDTDDDFVVRKHVDPDVRRRGRLEEPEVTDKTQEETPTDEAETDEKVEAKARNTETEKAGAKAKEEGGKRTASTKSAATSKAQTTKKGTGKSVVSSKDQSGAGAGEKKQTSKKEDESKSAADSPPKEEKEKIVDDFIKKSPNISPVKKNKAAEKEKKDLSEKSTRFKADVASEYLAEIYIEQGKYDRAISIYENLSLKFPEKKSYFAGLIEKLSKK